MTTARQEKPSVPTPDAAEVYAHHLSQMSRPMRVAVERYVDALAAFLHAEQQRFAGYDDADECNRCDVCGRSAHSNDHECDGEDLLDSLLAERTCRDYESELSVLRAKLDAFRAIVAPAIDIAGRPILDASGNPVMDIMKHEAWTAPVTPLTPSPAAGAVALAVTLVDVAALLPVGWRWEYAGGGDWADLYDHLSCYAGCAWPSGKWKAAADTSVGYYQAEPRTLAAAQAALLAELRKRGTLPAAAASADVHGLGSEWEQGHPDARTAPEMWEHTSGARIIRSRNGAGWFGIQHDGNDAHDGYRATAAEAARLALGTAASAEPRRPDYVHGNPPAGHPDRRACVPAASTAPAVVRGDGAGVDFEAIGDAAFDLLPSDPEPGYFAAHVVGAIKEAIGEYHRQLEQRLAQLEAAAGKKAGA